MENKEIEDRLYDIIVDKLAVPKSSLTKGTSLMKDLGADSLDVVELLLEIEKVFKISIPDNDAEKVETIGDIVTYLDNRLNSEDTQNDEYNENEA